MRKISVREGRTATVRARALALALVAAIMSLGAAAGPPASGATLGDRLEVGDSMVAGDQIASPNGGYRAVMQGDGNFVVYRGGTAQWSSKTNGSGADRVVMQGDGNFVVYAGGQARWASKTQGTGAKYVAMQDDGNLVVYTNSRRAVWSSKGGYVGNQLRSGATLNVGEALWSANRKYRGVMQGDGNFVLYHGGAAKWSSKTNGTGANRVVMQGDGNLVVYAGSKAKWSSKTNGTGANRVVMQDDRNLVVYAGSKAKWSSKTAVSSSTSGSPGKYSAPTWLPIRSAQVWCVVSNCTFDGRSYHGYWAIDFGAPKGTPVYAAGFGQVVWTTTSDGDVGCGGGRSLRIDHGNGVATQYAHFSELKVGQGSWVGPSTIIGRVGATGTVSSCSAYHLHYEKRVNASKVDPGSLSACQSSRLVKFPAKLGYTSWDAIPPYSKSVTSEGAVCS